MTRSIASYLAACAVVLLAKTAMVIWPVDHFVATAPLLTWPQLTVILVVGLAALLSAEGWGCARALAPDVSARRRWLIPAALGLVFASVEIGVSLWKGFPNIHAAFPQGIAAYGAFGIVYEIKQHLIPVGLTLGVVGTWILKGRRPGLVFLVTAVAVSLGEPIGQVGGLREMGLIGGPGSAVFFFCFIFAANLLPVLLFRRGGLFALLSFRLANYALWHVIWPAVYFGS